MEGDVGLRDGGGGKKCVFDFLGADQFALQFELAIDSAEEDDVALLRLFDVIARTEGADLVVLKEALPGEFGLMEVFEGDTLA